MRLIHFALCIAALALGGCVAPSQTTAVTNQQQQAITQLSIASTADSALLRSAYSTIRGTDRVLALGSIHRAIFTDFTNTTSEIDPALLDRALTSANSKNPLVQEVRLGRMDTATAKTWLADYGVILKLSNPKALRDAALSKFVEIVQHDAETNSVLAALDARADYKAKLVASATADSQSLAQLAGMSSVTSMLGNTDLSNLILSSFPDGPRRTAALDLLKTLSPK